MVFESHLNMTLKLTFLKIIAEYIALVVHTIFQIKTGTDSSKKMSEIAAKKIDTNLPKSPAKPCLANFLFSNLGYRRIVT